MNWNDYTAGALRTESSLMPLKEEVESRGLSNRLFHSIIGMSTEINELYDAIELIPFEKWDIVNIMEELGDMDWYLAIAFDDLKATGEINSVDINNLTNDEITNSMSKYTFIKALRMESAKCLDLSKKVMMYGKSINLDELSVSLLRQYMLVSNIIVLISQDIDTVDSVMHINLAKLKQRFPDKFDGYKAEIRDLESERKILEMI